MTKKIVNIEKIRPCSHFNCEREAVVAVVYDDYRVLFACKTHSRPTQRAPDSGQAVANEDNQDVAPSG